MTPTFAVVGHPNKGKSSVVATLAQDAAIAIGPVPGTTREADAYELRVDNQSLYRLVDTPGFQRPGAVLAWLQAESGNASQRAEQVAAFVEAHTDDPRYHDECALLRPVLAGAGILYVVDGSKPYGPEFELEMQILRWTGQPRMALINLIGRGDYVAQWRKALDQYFSIVRVFDAMQADHEAKVGLLRAFGELDQRWTAPLGAAVAALDAERAQRRAASAVEILNLLSDCLTYTEHRALPDELTDTADVQAQLEATLRQRLASREARGRQTVQEIYRHGATAREEPSLTLFEDTLFSEQSWQLFGLSREQLVATAGMSGAIAGGGLDLLLGGASLLLGSALGATVAGLSAWFGSGELAKVRVLGSPLGGRRLQVGPVKAGNFPWVLLGRAVQHWHLVSERNHALRDAFVQDLKNRAGSSDGSSAGTFFAGLSTGERRSLATAFAQLSEGQLDDARRASALAAIEALLVARAEAGTQPSSGVSVSVSSTPSGDM